jgi:hypothetical protein
MHLRYGKAKALKQLQLFTLRPAFGPSHLDNNFCRLDGFLYCRTFFYHNRTVLFLT